MKNISQLEKFEIGTVAVFTGLSFFTLVPVIMRSMFVFIEPNVYKFFGSFFLIITIVYYILSSDFYKKQLQIIGICFIIFALFQFFFAIDGEKVSLFSKYASLLLGIFLLSTGIYLNKKGKL